MALHHLQQQLAGHQRLLVAYSGGLDSTVLLHQLVCLRQMFPSLHLRAIHIHHGLNVRADYWMAHCQQQCANWQVPLAVVKVRVDSRDKGIEAAARAARYQAFRDNLQEGETLLTAQHQDDQSETLLLALKRGSGPAGLSGMPAQASLNMHMHLRPLLACSRRQLESWAAEYRLQWVEDDSNQDQRYDRNFLRQAVLPLLNTRWPHFSQSASRSARLCAEQEQLLDELLAESLNALVDNQGTMTIEPLAAMSGVRRNALIRRWIAAQQGDMPSRDALQRIWLEVACSREDAEPCLQLGRYEVRRYRNRLYWLERRDSLREVVIEWPVSQQSIELPARSGRLIRAEQGTAIRLPTAGEKMTVRFQAQGKYHIVGRAGRRPLKKLWQELAIPPWQRERIPLIFYGDQLIAAVGVFTTREGFPEKQPSWQVCWQQEKEQ